MFIHGALFFLLILNFQTEKYMAQKNNQSIDSKLDAIKDIIFGQEKADLEERLTALEASSASQFKDSHAALADFRVEVEGRFQRLEERLINQHNETLAMIQSMQADKADKKSIGEMLVKLGESIAS